MKVAALFSGFIAGVTFVFATIFVCMWFFPLDNFHERSHTLGEMFHAIAADEDAVADEWEKRLLGNGRFGWAGYGCDQKTSDVIRRTTA